MMMWDASRGSDDSCEHGVSEHGQLAFIGLLREAERSEEVGSKVYHVPRPEE
jgi:hypothetical protein